MFLHLHLQQVFIFLPFFLSNVGAKIQSPDFQRTVDLSGSEKNKQEVQSYKQGRKHKKLTESTPERIHHHRPRVCFHYTTKYHRTWLSAHEICQEFPCTYPKLGIMQSYAFCRQKHVVIIPTLPP
ncbi:hypothetical protein T10_585 [Trichinella papuae]|uniref:Secreted protein n=1 Tax=Trichinella papuae TaxID=268474 RepID=A0A0V1N9H8_9BILA|nr:hypothetical protein T10_585 [Trichinella papuae]